MSTVTRHVFLKKEKKKERKKKLIPYVTVYDLVKKSLPRSWRAYGGAVVVHIALQLTINDNH